MMASVCRARSTPAKRHFACRHGFTLVELLVVIAIISILASLLLPVLAQARNAAHDIACVNKMKQMGIAHISYCNDNDGYFPNTNKKNSNGYAMGKHCWIGYSGITPPLLSDYGMKALRQIKRRYNWSTPTTYTDYGGGIFCPSDLFAPKSSYALNEQITGTMHKTINTKIHSIRYPSKGCLMLEASSDSDDGYNWHYDADGYVTLWQHGGNNLVGVPLSNGRGELYQGSMNILHFDGHVGTYGNSTCQSGWRRWMIWDFNFKSHDSNE